MATAEPKPMPPADYRTVAKNKPADPPPKGKTLSIRLDGELTKRIADTAKGMGLEEAPLLRLILLEKLAEYEQRVKDIRARRID